MSALSLAEDFPGVSDWDQALLLARRGSCGPAHPAVYRILKCSSSQASLLGEVNKWFIQLCSSQTQTDMLQLCGSMPQEEWQGMGRIPLILSVPCWPDSHHYLSLDGCRGGKECSTERGNVPSSVRNFSIHRVRALEQLLIEQRKRFRDPGQDLCKGQSL